MNLLGLLAGIAAFFLPQMAGAQADPCLYVPGGCAPSNLLVTNVILTVASILVRVAGGLSVIFIIWACLQIVISSGDTSRITTARNAMIYALVGMAVVMMSQVIVAFMVTEGAVFNNAQPVDFDIQAMAEIVRVLLYGFNVAMGIYLFLAGTRMLLAHGKTDEFQTAKVAIIWCIVATIIANATNFVIQIVIGTLGLL